MITGIHTIVYTPQTEQLRAFFRDVLEYPFVDVGGGWPVFALPPAELGVHPCEKGGEHVDLYLMCDDLDATMQALTAKGVSLSAVTDQPWGPSTTVDLPGGEKVALYQPRHPIALGLKK